MGNELLTSNTIKSNVGSFRGLEGHDVQGIEFEEILI
jgi:hypothetical protein